VSFQGIDFFGLLACEVVTRMAEVASVAVDDHPASFVAPDLMLSF